MGLGGVGTYTIVTTKQMSTTNQVLALTVDDMDLAGTILTGTKAVHVHCVTPGRLVGIGVTAKQMHITGASARPLTPGFLEALLLTQR